MQGGDLHLLRSGQGAEADQLIRLAWVVPRIVHQDHSRRAVVSGVDGLADDFCVGRELLPREHTLLVVLLRLVTQHEGDLAFRVDPPVVVVVILGRGDPITRKDHRRLELNVFRKAERNKVLIQGQRLAGFARPELQGVMRTEFCANRHREVLEVGAVVPGRPKAKSAEMPSNVVARFVQFLRAVAAPFQLVTR